MRANVGAVLLALTVSVMIAGPARGDDGPLPFHRTTPRAALEDRSGVLFIGVPGGRAWGIESALRPLPPPGTTLVFRLDVWDDAVREAFVRIAYYGSAATRTRQLATADSEAVTARGRALVVLALEPPPGAIAFRVRVLARLADPTGRSADDAVAVAPRWSRSAAHPAGSLFSRLFE